MKKVILLFIIAIVGVCNATAQVSNSSQSEDLKVYVDSLATKLNTLQHDYDYLHCNYMLSEIQLNLKDFMNDLSAKSNAILINCYHSRFDFDLYSAYKANYISCQELYDSMKGKAEAITSAVAIKVVTSNFTDEEIRLLGQGCKFVDDCLSSAQSSLNYYKVVLDMYKDLR